MMKDRMVTWSCMGRALDKFGDHGLVICATAKLEGDHGGHPKLSDELPRHRSWHRDRLSSESFSGISGRPRRSPWSTAAYIRNEEERLVRDFYKDAGLHACSHRKGPTRYLVLGDGGWPVVRARIT